MNWIAKAKQVKAAIYKVGAPVTLVRSSTGSFIPSQGVFSGGSEIRVDTKAVLKTPPRKGRGFAQGSLEEEWDQTFKVPAYQLGFEPKAGDLVVFGGSQYTVEKNEIVNPGGVALLHNLHCKS